VIVRLTHRQLEIVDKIITRSDVTRPFADSFGVWLGWDIQTAPKHRLDVALPAIAWKLIGDALFDYCYDDRGFRTKKIKVSEINALKAVRRSLNVREAHPGLIGIGAIGMVSEIIPAWTTTHAAFSPYPTDGEFKLLVPTLMKVGSGRQVTKWVPCPDPDAYRERPILDEQQHLRFTNRSTTGTRPSPTSAASTPPRPSSDLESPPPQTTADN
jgi:hypothetical protein